MSKLLKQILILITLIAILVLPYFVFAGSPALDKLIDVGSEKGPYTPAGPTTVSEIVGTAINAFLSLLGVIFIVLIILAGHKWMTAGGNEEQLTKSKEAMRRAVVGLIIIIGAFAIWNFMAKFLLQVKYI